MKPKGGSCGMLMFALALLAAYPFVMMVAISFRNSADAYKPLFDSTVVLTLRNYKKVLSSPYFLSWYANTASTVLLTIAIRLVVTVPAAYSFARLNSRSLLALFSALLATMMIPGETTMVPRYLWYQKLHILDSAWVVILPEISEVFYLVLMTEFFRSIPEDFNEAARIDGAGHIRIITGIFIPLSIPSLVTTILFSFINIWNNYLDPYLFIKTIERQLITPALQFFQQHGGANVPVQLAGSALALVPVIILFVLTQRFFIEGVSSSGIKG